MNFKNGELNVCITNDVEKIKKQIKALEYIISIDTNETDKEIHKCALKEFKNKLKSIKRG
ncbi:hypothetical protein [Clostridium sp.]|uniref:hypothetical protein n=1 Tax=Clostridium sp. TaxID=1506 RepID=UPI003990C867